jgi:hypothetical protein
MLEMLVHDGWGLGSFKRASTPLARMVLQSIGDDPRIVTSWLKMFMRYYQNWSQGLFEENPHVAEQVRRTAAESLLANCLGLLDLVLDRFRRPLGWIARMLVPLSGVLNPAVELLLPVVEPPYLFLVRISEPLAGRLGKRFTRLVERADPGILENRLADDE